MLMTSVEDVIKISYFEDSDQYFTFLELILQQYCKTFNFNKKKNITLEIEHIGFDKLIKGPQFCVQHLKEKRGLDFILIDYLFTGLSYNGLDLIGRIKDEKIGAPIIMLSEQKEGAESINLNSNARKAGAKAFFTKRPLVYGDNKEKYLDVFFRDILQKTNAHRDKEDLKKINCELTKLSTIDSLTQLHNRRHFENKLEENLYSRENKRICVVGLDINNFKEVNDTYGHHIGDEYLKQFSLRLQKQIKRHEDLVARIGGDEFGIIILNPHDNYIENILSDIYDSLTKYYSLCDEVRLKNPMVSIGASILDIEQKPFDAKEIKKQLMQEADFGMYKHKQTKKGKYVMFDKSG